ncbi:hypothetical protein Hanom_Chr00s088578g01797931 [Helianthus anomalus]
MHARTRFHSCLMPQIILDTQTLLQTYLFVLQNFILIKTFQNLQASILTIILLAKTHLKKIFLLNKFRDEIS